MFLQVCCYLLCEQLLKLFVHSSNPSVKLYSVDSIWSVQKKILSLHRMSYWAMAYNKIMFDLVDHGLVYVWVTQDGKWELCLNIQNYHQLHLPLHMPSKGNCQSQTTVWAEVWRKGHLNGNHLPLLSWLLRDTSWFYKEKILQSVLHLCGRNQVFRMTETTTDMDDLIL